MSLVLDALGGRSDALITIDFETYWDREYSLSKLTTESYVRDPRFEVIGVGVKFGNSPAVWMEDEDFREWAARVDWSRVSVLAHHTHFDGLILSHHYGIKPRFLLCTMSMGRALHGTVQGVSLEKLAIKYGVGVKGKEVLKTQGKRRQDFTEADWLAFGAYCINDCELTHGLLTPMARGFPVEELWLIDTTIRMFTEPKLRADQSVLSKELTRERTKKAALLERIGQEKEKLSSAEKFATLLRDLGEQPPMKPNAKGQPIYAFAKSDPGMQTLLEHPRDEIRFLAEARLSVKSTLIETRTERLMGIGQRGAVPIYLRYCGAHTHRWSGGDKMNPQNFNRGGALREALLAPPGDILAVADSGQIEARVVAWLAGQEELLETFRRNDATGGDFYSDEGSRYFGRKLSKKETPVERQISKSMVLGLGFGMGWAKFAAELLKGMLGADPVQFTQAEAARFKVDAQAFERQPWGNKGATCGDVVREMIANGARVPYPELLIHSAVTAHFVNLYRQTNRRIAGLWRLMGDMLPVMAQGGGDPRAVRRTFGPLKFIYQGIVKPSGLVMHYPDLKRHTTGSYSYLDDGGRKRKHVYGGLLAENAVQSLARDIVAEQALWIRASKRPIGTTTHDEIVAIPSESDGPACLAHMLERMKIAPTWAAGLPLNATGGLAVSYGDAK